MKTNYPDSLTIQQYLEGKLDPKLMHALEKQALEDPFLFEALEGYSQISEPGHELSLLQRQLHTRIMLLEENKKVYYFTWQRLSVAAAAAVMFISAGVLFWMNSQKHETQIASNSKQVGANLTPLDTIKNTPQYQNVDSGSSEKSLVSNYKASGSVQNEGFITSNSSTRDDENANPAIRDSVIALREAPVVGYEAQNKQFSKSAIAGQIPGLATLSKREDGITGKITDKESGMPLHGVAVKIKGTGITTKTDSAGEFTLPLNSQETLQLTYRGYKEKEIKTQAGDILNVSLSSNGDLKQLFEMIVAGHDPQPLTELQPVPGWDFYREYLEENIRLPDDDLNGDDKVIIGFIVNPDGKLTKFRVITGSTDARNSEAIRLIKEGPAWRPASDGKPREARVEIDFNTK